MRSLIVVLCVAALVSQISGHSWIDCTDYAEVTRTANFNYDANACKARPRNWKNHNGGGVFGADTGYNFQGGSPEQCLYPLKAGVDVNSFYTTQYPMATYRQGQRVCLAWPAKNHVAASCTNPYIPDTSNKVYISGANPTADPTTWDLLIDWGNNPAGTSLENGGGQGFQNCPKFCDGMDKALCGRCFTIPANQPLGRYAFQWRWVFNAGTAPYTSCWDANIIAAGSGPAPPAPAPTTPTSSGTPGSTAAPATTQRPLTGDSVRISYPPTNVQIGMTSIPVTVEYSATTNVDIVVDFLSADYKSWYGKAIQKNVSPGTGKLNLSITVQNNPPAGDKVVKPWIVPAGKAEAEAGWAYELDKKEYVTAYTNNPPQSSSAPLSTVSPSSATKVVAATGFATVAVLVLSVLIIAV